MTTYSPQARLAAIQKAGFPDPLTALAVSLAEFGPNREVTAQAQSDIVTNGVQEPSFGPWQIHLPSHPDVVQSCAMDLTCSTQKAFDISKGGTDFTPWSTYTNGSYKSILSDLEKQFANLVGSPSAGDTGPAGPTPGPGASPKPVNPFDPFRGGSGFSGVGPPAGRDKPIVDVPAEVGKKVADATSGLTGIPAAIKSVQDSFRPENLWRAAFIVVGVGAVFIGGRMYLAQSPEPAQEGVPA